MVNKNKNSKKLSMVVFSHYPQDPRVRREAEALAEQGYSIDVICLAKSSQKRREIINQVSIYRIPIKRSRGGKGRYLFEYFAFALLAFIYLAILYLTKKYRAVHVHNMPDFLVFTSLIPRIFGASIILDLHDPTPEVFMAKYALSETHPAIKILCRIEQLSTKYSDVVLTPNIAFKNLFVDRGCPDSKINIIMNSPQESIFNLDNKKGNQNNFEPDRFKIMYHGTMTERYGIDVALQAFSLLRDKIPNLQFNVYGEGDYVRQFKQIVKEKNLWDIIDYHGFVPAEQIATAIQFTDIGIITNRPSIHWESALPTRIFEYLALEKPVIAPDTMGIKDYFNRESIYYFEQGNSESLAEVIWQIYNNPKHCKNVLEKGISVYNAHRWETQRRQLISIVNHLINPS